jgi:hypothetical protein
MTTMRDLMNTMRDLTVDELEKVSGGDGVGGIPNGILRIGQGMYQIGFDEITTQTTASMPLCGGATKVRACLLP